MKFVANICRRKLNFVRDLLSLFLTDGIPMEWPSWDDDQRRGRSEHVHSSGGDEFVTCLAHKRKVRVNKSPEKIVAGNKNHLAQHLAALALINKYVRAKPQRQI